MAAAGPSVAEDDSVCERAGADRGVGQDQRSGRFDWRAGEERKREGREREGSEERKESGLKPAAQGCADAAGAGALPRATYRSTCHVISVVAARGLRPAGLLPRAQ